MSHDEEFEDIEEAPEADEGELSRIKNLAATLLERQRAVEAAEEALTRAKADLIEIEEVELPKAMRDVGMGMFALEDGSRVELRTEHYGSITQEKSFKVLPWLEEHGFGSLIKRTVTAAFAKGDKELADKLVTALRAQAEFKKAKITDKSGVHHTTLKAFIREQIAQAASAGSDKWAEGSEEFDLFSVHVRRFVEVVVPGQAASRSSKRSGSSDEEF